MNYNTTATSNYLTSTIELDVVDKESMDEMQTPSSSCCCCNCKEWNWFQWTIWSFLLLTSLFMCSLAAPYFSFSDYVETWEHYKPEKYWVRLHIIPCFFVMLVSCHQICGPLRRKYLNMHRWCGRIYVTGCLFGGIGGLYMATNAGGGFPTRLSFTFIGVLWLFTTFMGFYYIKFTKKDNETEKEKTCRISQHRLWMLRSFSLMIAVAMFRYWLPLFQFGFGYGYGYKGEDIENYKNEQQYEKETSQYFEAFCAASWFCWTFNLVIVESYFWYQSVSIKN